MVINETLILKDYSKLKKSISKSLQKKKYENACIYLKFASILMYNANLFYSDNELDNSIEFLANKIFEKKINFTQKKVIVFYDYFTMDNRGLSEQFLYGLIHNKNYELVYISAHQKNNNGIEIYKKLKKENIITYELCEKNEIKKAQELYSVICKYSPENIIVHTAPWDISGLVAITALKNQCNRFLSNITDHAFWLGTKAFDFFIEWRDYGFNISEKYRNIEKNKLLKLPYYPIVNENVDFKGFSFNCDNKKIILSGGSLYKIQGSDKFLQIISYILDNYKDTIFLFLGSGDTSSLEQFCKQHNYENRLIIEKERKDIYEVMKHSFFYINTYPVSGGLMFQLACICGKQSLTLFDNGDKDNDVYELLMKKPNSKLLFLNLEDLYTEIDLLMNTNSETMQNKSIELKNSIMGKEEYTNYLKNYLSSPVNCFDVVDYNININDVKKISIKRFNEKNCKSYYRCFVSKKFIIIKKFWHYIIKYIVIKGLSYVFSK